MSRVSKKLIHIYQKLLLSFCGMYLLAIFAYEFRSMHIWDTLGLPLMRREQYWVNLVYNQRAGLNIPPTFTEVLFLLGQLSAKTSINKFVIYFGDEVSTREKMVVGIYVSHALDAMRPIGKDRSVRHFGYYYKCSPPDGSAIVYTDSDKLQTLVIIGDDK